MELLVCGMHRSGTSAVAHLLARACGRSLLEDPDWAMTGRLVDVERWAPELAEWDMLKCPRMTEVLPRALVACPAARAAVLVRDPRDVLCSIMEKVDAGMPTRMLEFSRLGVSEGGAAGFAAAYRIYARTISGAVERQPERVRLIVYEQFCRDKRAALAGIAEWMGWACGLGTLAPMQDRQLGPDDTKPAADRSIKGPRRWVRDLAPADAEQLAAAVAAYDALCRGAPAAFTS